MNRCKQLLLSVLLVLVGPAIARGQCPPQPANCNDMGNMSVPTIECTGATQSSIDLRVCAGGTGAPAGVTIQWAVFDGTHYCHQDYSNLLCSLSLSGQCPISKWTLGPGECSSVTIHATTVEEQNAGACGASEEGSGCGDLQCDTQYIFFVFAHNKGQTGRSCFSTGVVCRTAPCNQGGGCTLTWGYWKTHGPAGCNPSGGDNKWNVTSLTIGCQTLTDAQLCAILQQAPSACAKGGGPNAGANATLILEHQLIAALLNKANGAIDCAFADAAITAANGLLCGNEFACTGASSALGQQEIAVAGTLAAYNSDLCSCPNSVTPVTDPEGVTPVRASSWGKLKLIYR